MYPFWILLELRVMEVVAKTGAIRRAKLQSNRHHQQTNTRRFKDGCHCCRPPNSIKALKGNFTTMTKRMILMTAENKEEQLKSYTKILSNE